MRLTLGILLVALVASSGLAQPTPENLATAKTLYDLGKGRYEAKDYLGASVMFKESYRLSENPKLLLNIAVAYQDSGDKKNAIVYYQEFLTKSPAEEPERARAEEQIKLLEAELAANPDAGAGAKKFIKPPGTYTQDDFEHVAVMEAPPDQPLDVTAFVPEDSGFALALYFRGTGEAKFTGVEMAWRYRELVGRIPATKLTGSAIQYYIEVKDKTGEVVARSGKPSSPNVVDVVPNVPARFYPDWTESKPVTQATANATGPAPTGGKRSGGWVTPGSRKFTYLKWGTTGAAAALFGGAVWLHLDAGRYAQAIEEDSSPVWDDKLQEWQDTGKSRQTWSRVSIGVGVAVTAAAGYLWYRDLTHAGPAVGLVPMTDGKTVGASLAGSF